MLYAMMREDTRPLRRRRARSYKCSLRRPTSCLRSTAITMSVDRRLPRCQRARFSTKTTFLTELERPDTVDRFSHDLRASRARAQQSFSSLVSSLGRGEPVRFFWAFSSITIVAAPIGLLCAFGAGYKNIARRLLASGAALAGARQANLLRGTEEVVLRGERPVPDRLDRAREHQGGLVSIDETRILSAALRHSTECGRS